VPGQDGDWARVAAARYWTADWRELRGDVASTDRNHPTKGVGVKLASDMSDAAAMSGSFLIIWP